MLYIADMNECDSDPCVNDGTCVDDVNGYNCDCVRGYADENCDVGEYMTAYKNKVMFPNVSKYLRGKTLLTLHQVSAYASIHGPMETRLYYIFVG